MVFLYLYNKALHKRAEEFIVGVGNYNELRAHIDHKLVCVYYGAEHEYEGDPENVAVECETCGEVIIDFNKPEPVEGKQRRLWKTTMVIWSDTNVSGSKMEDIARDATHGDSYCSFCETVVVDNPGDDPHWDNTEFFGMDEEYEEDEGDENDGESEDMEEENWEQKTSK